MVLGNISLSNRIAMVSIAAEPAITYSPSNAFSTSEPTPKAPTVCAMVLRVSIAVSGRSGSSFQLYHTELIFSWVSDNDLMCPCDVESSTASSILHRKDAPSAINA